jgi:hypothetical protein
MRASRIPDHFVWTGKLALWLNNLGVGVDLVCGTYGERQFGDDNSDSCNLLPATRQSNRVLILRTTYIPQPGPGPVWRVCAQSGQSEMLRRGLKQRRKKSALADTLFLLTDLAEVANGFSGGFPGTDEP